MPRKRNKENLGFPDRWRLLHGKYRYQVPPGQEHLWDGKKTFTLGTSRAEAYKVWAERIERQTVTPERTIGNLLQRYSLEVTPKKALRTQADDARQITSLRKAFEHRPISSFEPQHAYRYVDECVKAGRGFESAKNDLKPLSHAFTWAVRWGLLKRNPLRGEMRWEGNEASKARDRYIEDWELSEILSLKPFRKHGSVRMIQTYIRIKYMTGFRRSDMLRLSPAQHFTDEGIDLKARKTAKTTGHRVFCEWSDDLRAAVEDAKAARPVDIAPWLFCTDAGACYVQEDGTCSGWDSIWQRFVDRVLKETEVTRRFTEHDIRGKTGSDAESLEAAAKQLGHVDVKVTKKHYRRKGERIVPLKRKV